MISWYKFSIGVLAAVLACGFYYVWDFHAWILLLWLAGLLVIGWSFKRGQGWTLSRFDALAIATLLAVFIPVYFLYLYQVPVQMNTDEPTIMIFQKLYQHSADIFGVSSYFNFPAFIFIVTAKLQNLLGGINIIHAKATHASFAILIILLCYWFFRQFWYSFLSFLAASVVGANHALIGISRMAMRDNSALLTFVLPLPFLYLGLRKQSLFYTFIGSALAGLSFYVYAPGRIFIFIWLGFLFLTGIFFRKKYGFHSILKLFAVTFLGFVLVVAPIMIAEHNHPDPNGAKFNRERFLFNSEGQEQQKEWVGAQTLKEGIIVNVKNGLTTFNNHINDLSYVYPNMNHGFVDPISGVLLWLGVLSTLYSFLKKQFRLEDLLNTVGFFGLWLLFAFVINKSPNYTRLLIILPFFAYFVTKGLLLICQIVGFLAQKMKFREHKFLVKSLALAGLLMIFTTNLLIFGDFAQQGLDEGNNVGTTARFVESRQAVAGLEFILVADQENQYYSWGEAWQWKDWLGVFKQPNQSVLVLGPQEFLTYLAPKTKVILFMNENVWTKYEVYVRRVYPNLNTYPITTDGHLLAIEPG